jgi:hypothetical protein
MTKQTMGMIVFLLGIALMATTEWLSRGASWFFIVYAASFFVVLLCFSREGQD